MIYESNKKTIKSVVTNRYEVIIKQDKSYDYHISAENFTTKKKTEVILRDYNMASYAFETALQQLEGN